MFTDEEMQEWAKEIKEEQGPTEAKILDIKSNPKFRSNLFHPDTAINNVITNLVLTYGEDAVIKRFSHMFQIPIDLEKVG